MQTASLCSVNLGYRRLDQGPQQLIFFARPKPNDTAVLGCVAVGLAEHPEFTTLKVGWAAAESHHMPLSKSNLLSKQWKGEAGWT